MQIYSYQTGEDILYDHIEDIESGKYRVLLFFLGSKYDNSFLQEVVDLRKDLHKLTGEHCLAILFSPPPESSPWGEGRKIHLSEFYPMEDWPSFVEEMTQKTYELAAALSVSFQNLPCIAFVNPHVPERVAILRIQNASFSSHYMKLRGLFSDWYQEHKVIFDQFEYLSYIAKYGYGTNLGTQKPPSSLLSLIREKVAPTISSIIEEAFMVVATDSHLYMGLVRRRLKTFRKQPRNLSVLIDLLTEYNLTITTDNKLIGPKQLAAFYENQCEELLFTRDEALTRLESIRTNLPDFPLERVKEIDSLVQLEKIDEDSLKKFAHGHQFFITQEIVKGDKIIVRNIQNATGIAIGRGSQANLG